MEGVLFYNLGVRRRDGALKAATRCRTPNGMFPFNNGLDLSYYQRNMDAFCASMLSLNGITSTFSAREYRRSPG
jgi:hypothetical protein